MKATDTFKQTIESYLQRRALDDQLFAETLNKPGKNIDDCITYILNQVKDSGMNGFADEEIYQMAVHYYDEDGIKPGAKIKCQVIVNHQVELTPEEIEKARKEAFNQFIAKQQDRLARRKETKVKTVEEPDQLSLF